MGYGQSEHAKRRHSEFRKIVKSSLGALNIERSAIRTSEGVTSKIPTSTTRVSKKLLLRTRTFDNLYTENRTSNYDMTAVAIRES